LRTIAFSLAALLASFAGGSADATPRFDTINIVVGFSPGGGTDAYARLLARFLPRHLEGEPKVLVQNMPGSGSLKAVQSLAAGAPKRSAVIVAFNYGLITDSQLNPDRARVRLSDYNWIGSLAPVPAICYAWRATGVASWTDLKARTQFTVGAPAVGSSNHINAMMLKNVLRAQVRAVTGYPGSADERLAVERGELDGGCGAWSSVPPEWIAQNKIAPLVSFASSAVDGVPEGVPFAVDLADTPQRKAIIRMLIGPSEVGRPFIMARDAPAEDVAALRRAFETVANDREFLAEAKRIGLPISVIPGIRAEELIARIYATPADVIAAAKGIME